ncbi:MAG: LEPR-XLL domain-containing protein [Candidatus Brocadiae bacterium]|nr:LEPR-XLL domain-containing protein [Candidatus Brocadiia bacterium]
MATLSRRRRNSRPRPLALEQLEPRLLLDGAPQALPVVEDFATGLPGEPDGWDYYSSADGRIVGVASSMRMDDSVDGGSSSLNEAILHLDLAGESNVIVTFDHTSNGDEVDGMPDYPFTNHEECDGVAFSADGIHWHRLTDLAGSFDRRSFDLDAAAAAAGVSYTSDFRIKFQQYDNYSWGTDGRAFDDVSVMNAPLVDNGDVGFETDSGAWYTFASGYAGDIRYAVPGAGGAVCAWEFLLPYPFDGLWDVQARWPAYPTNASDAPFTVHHAGGSTTVRMDQRANGDEWVSLGIYPLISGWNVVTLADDVDGYVVADAVRIVPAGIDTTPPTLEYAAARSQRTVTVRFNEPLDPTTAEDTGNYTIDRGLDVTGAYLSEDQMVVRLNVLPDHDPWSGPYTLTVSHVEDVLGNLIAPGSTIEYQAAEDTDFIVDDSSARFFLRPGSDVWPEYPVGYDGSFHYHAAGTGVNGVQWSPYIKMDGWYEIYERHVSYSTSASDATYTIEHAAGTTDVMVDQRVNSEQWNLLGTFPLEAGFPTVTLTDDANGYVVADALRYEYLGPDLQPPKITGAQTYSSNRLRVFFGERMDPASATHWGNYTISGGVTVDVAILEDDGQTVYLVTSAQAVGMHTVTVNNVRDALGNVIFPGSLAQYEVFTPVGAHFQVVDNSEAGFHVLTGTWRPYPAGVFGSFVFTGPGAGSSTVEWEAVLPEAGMYEVSVKWEHFPVCTTAASYIVHHAGGSSQVLVNQQMDDGGWYHLGWYPFDAGPASVTLNNDARGYVVADAARFDYVGGDYKVPAIAGAHWVQMDGDPAYRVNVIFGEVMDYTTAADVDNYAINHGVGVLSATPTLVNDHTEVLLETSVQTPWDGPHTVTVTGVRDVGGLFIPPGTTVEYQYAFDAVVDIDNTDPDRFNSAPVVWPTLPYGFAGSFAYYPPTAADAAASWIFPAVGAGYWEVFANWVSYSVCSSNVTYSVIHDGVRDDVEVDQRHDGGEWVSLGIYSFNVGGFVAISADAGGYVVADAVRFEYYGPSA